MTLTQGHARLEAGGNPINLVFTYTIANPAESQMNGGLFQMVIPEGWAFAAAVAANDGIDAGIADRRWGLALTGRIFPLPDPAQ